MFFIEFIGRGGVGWRRLTRGGGGVRQLLTRGGGGVWKPPKLADIICGQPLTGKGQSTPEGDGDVGKAQLTDFCEARPQGQGAAVHQISPLLNYFSEKISLLLSLDLRIPSILIVICYIRDEYGNKFGYQKVSTGNVPKNHQIQTENEKLTRDIDLCIMTYLLLSSLELECCLEGGNFIYHRNLAHHLIHQLRQELFSSNKHSLKSLIFFSTKHLPWAIFFGQTIFGGPDPCHISVLLVFFCSMGFPKILGAARRSYYGQCPWLCDYVNFSP